MKTAGLLIMSFTILCLGCSRISREKTMLTVGKIDTKSYSGKNGATRYTYFVNGIRYLGTSRFDVRDFNNGDMVLLYVEKANPSKTHKPIPEIKIFPMNNGDDSICMAGLGINLEDFRLVSNYDIEP